MLNGTQTIHSWNEIELSENWVHNQNSTLSVSPKKSKLASGQRQATLAEVFAVMHQTLELAFKNQQKISCPCKIEIESLKARVHERYENYLYKRGFMRSVWDSITKVFFSRISVDHSYKELIKLLNRIGDIEIERQHHLAPPVNLPPPTPIPVTIAQPAPIQTEQPAPPPKTFVDLTRGYSKENYASDLVKEGKNPDSVPFLNPNLEQMRRFEVLRARRLVQAQNQPPVIQRAYNPTILNSNNNSSKPSKPELNTSPDWKAFLTQETPANEKIVIFVTDNTDRTNMKGWTEETLNDIKEHKDLSYHLFVKENSNNRSKPLNRDYLRNCFQRFQQYYLNKNLVSFDDFTQVATQYNCLAQNTSNDSLEEFNEKLQQFIQRCVSGGKEVRLIIDQPTLTKSCFDHLQDISQQSNDMFRIHTYGLAY